MPSLFKIFPEHNLVYVRYWGRASIADYLSVVVGYTSHPDFNPNRKILVDLTGLTDIERDYAAIMQLQAKIAEYAMHTPDDILSVVVAPSPVALEAAKLVFQSWESLDSPVVRRIAPNMQEAAGFLGIGHEALDGILSEIAPADLGAGTPPAEN